MYFCFIVPTVLSVIVMCCPFLLFFSWLELLFPPLTAASFCVPSLTLPQPPTSLLFSISLVLSLTYTTTHLSSELLPLTHSDSAAHFIPHFLAYASTLTPYDTLTSGCRMSDLAKSAQRR